VPADYKALKKGQDVIPGFMWSNAMILKILQNEQYAGMYVAGKHERKMIGSSYQSSADESEWIRIPNRHPAIICGEDFERVQQKFAKRKHGKDKERRKRDYLLLGKIFCGCCKRAMNYGASVNPAFRCVYTRADRSAECHKMKFSVRDVDEAVICTIKKQTEIILNSGDISGLRNMSTGEQQITECESQIRQWVIQRQNHYERFVMKKIDRDEYLALKNDCANKIDSLNIRLALLEKSETEKNESLKMTALAKDVLGVSASSKEVIDTLIEKVFVFPDNRLEIQWKFTDFTRTV
jgi:hypothetical protein